jgi:hypothetical protein
VLESRDEAVVIAGADLRVASAVISLRFEDVAAEQRRLALVDELLRATSNLSRALAGHARHGLSESRGTHSAWDMASDAEAVFEALVRYETLVYAIGYEYRLLVAAAQGEHENGTDGESTRAD